MHIEHLSHWSGNLNREMYLNRYGRDRFSKWPTSSHYLH